MTGEKPGHRRVTDRDEYTVAGELADAAGAQVAQANSGHGGRLDDAEDLVDDAVPDDADFGVAEQPLLQDLFGPQRVAAVHESDLPRMIRQVDRFLHGRVAAADHDDVLAAKEKPIASSAGGHAKAAEDFLAGQAEPAGLRAGRDDHRLADVNIRIAGRDVRPLCEVDFGNQIDNHPGSDMLGLTLHLLHQPRALDDLGKARVVLDVGGNRHLTAGLEAGHEDRLQIGPRRVDRRGVASRPGADDHDLAVVTLRHRGIPWQLTIQYIISRRSGGKGCAAP